MGRRLIELVLADPRFELAGALERSDSPFIGRDALGADGSAPMGIKVTDDFGKAAAGASVYLDFSSAEGVLPAAESAAVLKIPAVIGVTALDGRIVGRLKELSEIIPILQAPNMSTGVNLLYKLAAAAAAALGEGYDLEIVEAHHRRKKDAPSGTALKILETLCEARGLDPEKAGVFGRSGTPGPRSAREIGVHAVRGGDVIGDHAVIFAGPGELLEITHRAQSRDAFATGALKAALWIVGKEPGFYSYRDVLGL
jgi:4-hydroxy-tetrahydrodipicolinate reductase